MSDPGLVLAAGCLASLPLVAVLAYTRITRRQTRVFPPGEGDRS